MDAKIESPYISWPQRELAFAFKGPPNGTTLAFKRSDDISRGYDLGAAKYNLVSDEALPIVLLRNKDSSLQRTDNLKDHTSHIELPFQASSVI